MSRELIPAPFLMNLIEFNEKISNSPIPLVIDFWTPWCGPCKAMQPVLAAVAQQFAGKVELLKINVDESPEIARSLSIMGIPTTLVYAQQKPVFRKTGMLDQAALESLFSDLAQGKTEITRSIPAFDRVLRLAAGTGLVVWGVLRGPSILLILLGAAVAFTAVYDRCPIYRAVSKRIKTLFIKIKNPA